MTPGGAVATVDGQTEQQPVQARSSGERRSPFWGVQQAAEHYSISERQVMRLVEQKLIPHFWVGESIVRFDPEELRAWEKAGGASGLRAKRKERS